MEGELRLDFTIALVDDFNLVLGMDLLQPAKVVLLPHLCSLLLMRDTPLSCESLQHHQSRREGSVCNVVRKGTLTERVHLLGYFIEEEGQRHTANTRVKIGVLLRQKKK